MYIDFTAHSMHEDLLTGRFFPMLVFIPGEISTDQIKTKGLLNSLDQPQKGCLKDL